MCGPLFILFFSSRQIYLHSLSIIPKYNSTMENELPTPREPSLPKLLSFLAYHSVEPSELWNSEPYLSPIQFSNAMLQKFGYQVSMDELIELRKLTDQGGRLFVQSFHGLGLWREFVGQERERKAHGVSRVEKLRPQTAKNPTIKHGQTFKGSMIDSGMSHKVQLGTESCVKNRQKEANEVLNKKILQNALDKKWQYLIKVGQMNAWKKQLKISHRTSTEDDVHSNSQIKPCHGNKIYKIEDHDQNILIIEQKQNGERQALPLKVFDQKYSSMKKKIATEEKTKNNMKGTMLLVLDKQQKVSKSKLNEKISQRDQELNYLLLQIMRMKDLFQQQEQILTECGVNM